jgi:hypothetical protein
MWSEPKERLMLIPEWMSSEEVEQALLLISEPHRPHPVMQALERLSQEDWSGLFLAYQFLMLARERESVH